MSMRSRGFKSWLRQGVALSLLAFLAACGSTGVHPPSTADKGYLLTVPISSSDTQAAIAQKYSGEVIVWLEDKAILKMSKQAVAQMKSSGISMQGTTLDDNSNMAPPEGMVAPDEAPISGQSVANTAGWNTWAGGWNTWAGGWNAWAGGWNAWAGGTGTVPALPSDNRFDFLITKLPQAQAIAKNFGSGIKVAVIDTGVDLNHPMLSGRLAPSTDWKDFVDGDATPQEATGTMYGHGTAVAGLVLQTAPRATILPIRVLDGSGGGDVANVASAISWAMSKGANVINLSLGTTDNNAALQTVIDSATAAGIYVVASAGNTGTSTMTYPAAWAKTGINAKYLLSAGSVSQGVALSSFCSSGTPLEFLAVGEGIASAYPGNQAASYNGTSFAAPQVSGALALALSDTASANKGNLESYLSTSGTTVGSYKLINSVAFLQKLPDFLRKQALLVAGSTKLNSADSAVKTRLESLGYTVTVKTATATASDATGKNIVLISETVDSATVNSKFRNVAVPVVAWDDGVYDDMNLTGYTVGTDHDYTSFQTQVSISNTTHPLGAGLSGTVTAYSSQYDFTWGVPASSAIKAATLTSNSSRAVIFGYDSGASMIGGFIAPARRVGLLISDFGAEILTNNGWQLFDAAITWAVSGN